MYDHSSTGSFARRLAHLRAILAAEPAEAGDQALKLLEEYLEQLALHSGYRQERGSIGRYVGWLRNRARLDAELLDRADSYAAVRNCLAHSYGLQTSPALAAELLDFLGALIREETTTAATMMSAGLRTVPETAWLREARDLMLREGFGRLPVIGADGSVSALLVDRDIVAAEALAARGDGLIDKLSVAEALPAQARRRLVVLPAAASYEHVVEALRRPGVEALIITRDGRRNQTPLGIVTHADVLYRM